MLSGDNGILQRTTDAKTKSNEAQIKERVRLAYNSALTRDLTNGNGVLTKPTLDDEIAKEFGDNGEVTEEGKYWVISVDGVEIERVAKSTTTPVEEAIVAPAEGEYEEKYDISKNENGSVWAYLVKNGDDYEAIIVGEGEIYDFSAISSGRTSWTCGKDISFQWFDKFKKSKFR